jgi:hypothetical protein
MRGKVRPNRQPSTRWLTTMDCRMRFLLPMEQRAYPLPVDIVCRMIHSPKLILTPQKHRKGRNWTPPLGASSLGRLLNSVWRSHCRRRKYLRICMKLALGGDCVALRSRRTHIYFANIHPSIPIIHQYRFLAALNLSPNTRPPIALRYAMWTLAATVSGRYQNLHEPFYVRARKYAEQVEMSGHGEKVASTALTQAWILIGIYELKLMYYPRVWLSTGRAVRLAQMLGMHRLDGFSSCLKQTLSPPRDWIEKEERRRTFWMAFCMDRYATVGTGWPTAIDEEDVSWSLI